MDKDRITIWWKRFQESSIFKAGRFITNSAAFALLITAVITVYQEVKEESRSEEIMSDLEDLSTELNAISDKMISAQNTRYLGIFPNYIQVVNEILQNSTPKDTIVIFEDVLYYGFLSKPQDFLKMNQLLLNHADQGGATTIVYYDEEGRTFHRMIREELISSSLYVAMEKERRSHVQSGPRQSLEQLQKLDTLLCNKYLDLSRKADPGSFKKLLKNQTCDTLITLCMLETDCPKEVEALCARIDSTRSHYLGDKSFSSVSFFDFENMDRSITKHIASVYKAHGIELWPLDEYLTMSCWLAGNRAVLAFPSKWSSDEIGFFSQDPAFAKYITAMLLGVKSSTSN